MQLSRLHKLYEDGRSVQEAWSKGQIMQLSRMQKNCAEGRIVQKAWWNMRSGFMSGNLIVTCLLE
eukprot:scaffold2386_cov126-Skeletonema_marinoi.AAC.2